MLAGYTPIFTYFQNKIEFGKLFSMYLILLKDLPSPHLSNPSFLIPHLSSLTPHPQITHPSFFIPHLPSLIPLPSSVTTAPSSLLPHHSSFLHHPSPLLLPPYLSSLMPHPSSVTTVKQLKGVTSQFTRADCDLDHVQRIRNRDSSTEVKILYADGCV